jgi:translation initiation factor 1
MAKKPLPDDAPALGSLADLLRQRGVTVAQPATPPAAEPAAPSGGGTDLARAGKLVVRRERKGHGGKTVTVIDGLSATPGALDELARAMRKALGCGSWIEDGRIVLQGDRPDAAVTWLMRRGARQVTRGN